MVMGSTLFKSKLSNVKVSKKSVIKYLYYKAGFSFFRGLWYTIFNSSRVAFPFFRDRFVAIRHSEYFYAGRSCYIGRYSMIDCLSKNGIRLGDRVTIREHGWIQATSKLSNPGEGLTIGNNTYIGPRSVIGPASMIIIGHRVQMGSGVNMIAENHQFDDGHNIIDQGVVRRGITIGDDCWIGNNAIILDGVEIGQGAVVGAGAVVTQSVPANSVVSGNPARVLKYRNE